MCIHQHEYIGEHENDVGDRQVIKLLDMVFQMESAFPRNRKLRCCQKNKYIAH